MALTCGSPLAAQPSPDYPFLSFRPGPVIAESPADEPNGTTANPDAPSAGTTTAEPDQPLIGDAQSTLNRLQASNRPYEDDPERLEALTTLGSLLQEQGDHEEAIRHFEQAMQLVRVSEGLFSERQLPMQAAIIDSHLALGDYEQADDMQASRLHLIRQNHPENSDTRRDAENRWARWNITYYLHHYLYRAAPDTFSITRQHAASRIRQPSVFRSAQRSPFEFNTMRGTGPLRTGRYLSPMTPRLNEAQDQFLEHLESGSTEQRLATLKSLLAIAYYRNLEVAYRLRYQDIFREVNPVNFSDAQHIARDTYLEGVDLIEQLLEELPAESPLRDELLLIEADWHLVFDYRNRADETYSRLHESLSTRLSGEALTTFFNPGPVTLLPTYVTHQYSPQPWSERHAEGGSGYLDTRLDINIDGSIRRVSITGSSSGTPDRLRLLLRDYLDTLVVRPPILNGALTRSRDQPVRFHYKY